MMPCAWWHQPAMQPLEAIRLTAEALERGEPVPPAAASIMAHALRQYLAGLTDITRNLGLRPRRGGTHETPLKLEQAAIRNQAIRELFESVPGATKTERAQQTAVLLRNEPDHRITEADVFRCVAQLHADFGGNLPTSTRQILRVIDRETIADTR